MIARVGTRVIGADDFKTYLTQSPMGRRGALSEKTVKDRLDDMIAAEILYQEALRLKLDQDPAIKHTIRRLFGEKLLDATVVQPARAQKPSEQDLKKYYDEHLGQYSHPEMIRLLTVFIAVPENAPSELKAEKHKLAEKVLAEAQARAKSMYAFSLLIKKYSDVHPKYSQGDTGLFDKSGEPVGIDPKLAEAGFALDKNSRVADQLVQTSDGFFIFMRVEKKPAINRSFNAVRRQIAMKLQSDAIITRKQEYVDGLRAKADISVDEQMLGEVFKSVQMLKQKRAPIFPNSPPSVPGQMPAPPPLSQQGEK